MEINIRTLRDIVNSFRLTQEQREYLVKSIMAGDNADTTWDQIQNKPTFADVATSGNYDDLIDTPDLTIYQPIEDNSLDTDAKTIPAAINEIKESVNSISDPYEINITNLLSAEDSESISAAIGGIDNLNATVQDNRLIVGTISNGSVSVSIRILGNVTTLYYLLDSVVGLTLNEIAITNTSGTLSKRITTHSVLTENMVINSLESNEATLPLSAAQGKVLATDKQDKTDNTLDTEDKTIPGSINELLTLINNNNNIVIFNKETLTYNSAKDAIENNKLIFYSNSNKTPLYFIYSNKILNNAIQLYGGNIFSRYYNSYDRGEINVIVINIDENENVNVTETNFYINEGGINSNDGNTLTTKNKTVELIKERLKYSILKLGNGLAWDTNDFINNTINITLDTNVFFVAESAPASPTDNQKKKICLVPADATEEGNFYTEYVWVVNEEHPDGYWEEFGTYKSEVDLTPYLKSVDAANTYLSKTDAAATYQPKGEYQPTGDYALKSELPSYTTVPELTADYTIPANATTREYIYEISIGATTYNVTAAEGIKWIDNNPPLIEANSKLIISVINNIAVWGTVYE